MNKKYHFISGLPRSGSTLLTAILNQNPRFYSNISNPLARFVRSIITESYAGPGYHLQCTEPMRRDLIKNLITTYHQNQSAEVCFNTNRGWTGLLPQIEQVFPYSKVICCVRDINWVLDSFEVLFKKNPFTMSRMYSESEAETVYSRCNAQMTPGHTVRFAYDSLKEAICGPQRKMLMLIEYDELAKNPERTMRGLYNFIGEPYYNHDYDSVEAAWDEYDQEAGIAGLHTIRRGVRYIPRDFILPPDVLNQFHGLEVWR
jgi:sulfotransferase